MVDLRLNILDKYVDYFVISESTKTHQGKEKKINFKINNFDKFKNKIKFIIADYKGNVDFEKHVGGESPIEQHQRNSLIEGIKDAHDDDLIILSSRPLEKTTFVFFKNRFNFSIASSKSIPFLSSLF